MKLKKFVITGRVLNAGSALAASNLRVEAWDKDLLVDDLVGGATPDAEGNFRIVFGSDYFQELFTDRKPDLFFKVYNEDTLLKSTEDSVLWNVDSKETVADIDLGASDTTTTFFVFATPVDLKLPNDKPIGDHTWVSTNVTDVCWACLGGTTENFYCGSSHWSNGNYTPPDVPLTSGLETGTGTIEAATCMGFPKRSTFLFIPSSAGIVYAVNGVCHQITNRVLYFTGASVEGAKGYDNSKFLYGVYGTFVPFLVLCPIVQR